VPGVEVRWGRGALAELRGEWEGLWERCPQATPFQHPAWLFPWSRHFGGTEFLVATSRRGEALVGVAPFFVIEGDDGGRELLLLGTGNTDYLDVLIEPGVDGAVVSELLTSALEASGCDRCELRRLRAGTALLSAAPSAGWEGEVVEDEPCPVLALPAEVGRLGEVVRPGHLARVRRDGRRLARRGVVEMVWATEANVTELFDALVELHQRRWRGDGEAGIFADDAVVSFQREVVAEFLRAGWLRLFALRCEGRTISCHYAFSCRGRFYNYIGGYDPDYAHWSPGALAVLHAIEAAIAEGAREFDFLRGREGYKYDWGARDELTLWRRLRRSGADRGEQAEARAEVVGDQGAR